jgi:PAS domain-containing protein
VTGPDWRILRINHAFSRITGFTPADLIGEKSPLLELRSLMTFCLN